jgi:hypothetical protein
VDAAESRVRKAHTEENVKEKGPDPG